MSLPLITTLINSNGSLSTTNPPICEQTPTQHNQLTNKSYVDTEINSSKLTINEVRIIKNKFSYNKQNVTLTPNSMTVVTNDDSWSSLGGGTNGTVLALVIDSMGNIYVAGVFTLAGTLPCNNIAMWNPSISQWSTLGTGTENGTKTVHLGTTAVSVTSLAIDSKDNLYVAGYFTQAGGVPCNYIAQWNPNTQFWSALETGTNNPVLALSIGSNDILYVGGEFTNFIAQWNTNTQCWSELGIGTNGTVLALSSDSSNNVYVAGYFTYAGVISCNSIAIWDGSSWSALGGGITSTPSINFPNGGNGQVNALAVDSSNNVYVGGIFTLAGTVPCSNVAKWNVSTSTWSGLPYDPTFNSGVSALAVDSNNNVYIGGSFTVIGSISCINIAVWNQNANNFSALGTGIYYSAVNALAIDNIDNVSVGGYFTQAGGVNDTVGLAEWGSTTSDVSVNSDSTVTVPKNESAAFFFTKNGSVYTMPVYKL